MAEKNKFRIRVKDFVITIINGVHGERRHTNAKSRKNSVDTSHNNPVPEEQFIQDLHAEVVKKEDLTQDDIIVAIMGPTGAGKSTFIETASSFQGHVGHSLQSCTSEIQAVRITFADALYSVVLVDTPGFDDTYRSDLDILKLISQWLQETYEKGLCLSGILYLHRISDNRMAGTTLKNLGMFEKLCGADAYKKIILTTTMWQDVLTTEGDEREEELQKSYWAAMLSRGSRIFRLEKSTREMAWKILNSIITQEHDSRAVQIQEELVNLKKDLPQTQAGQQLYALIEQLAQRQEDLLRRMREEMSKTSDPAVMRQFAEELIGLRRKRDAAIADMRQLDTSLVGRFQRLVGRGA